MAQAWADQMARTGIVGHSANSATYGENIHYRFPATGDDTTILKAAVDSWYGEVSAFDFKNPEDSLRNRKVGHFTCLVWKSSTEYGIGVARAGDKVYVCMNTYPKPNTVNLIRENVS